MRTCLAALLLTALLPAQAGTYTTFGTGCAGSGLAGWITPRAAVTAWGSTQNAFPFGTYNMRFQQQIDASEMPTAAQVWTVFGLREDTSIPQSATTTISVQIMFGTTTYTSTTLTSTFATNATGAQTTVYTGNMVLPGLPTGNTDLTKFHYFVKFAKPYVFLPLKTGENFLVEVLNTATTAPRRYPDCWAGTGANGSRLYATGTTAATGTVTQAYNLVFLFGNGAIPALGNTGVPTINQAFSIDLSQARASTAAGLILGGSNSVWGPINLPLDLTPASAPGCSLLVSFDALGATTTDGTGNGSIKLGLPNDSSLLGIGFHNQYFVLDKEANGLGLSFSNGGSGKIGK